MALPERLRSLARRVEAADYADLQRFQAEHFGAASRQADAGCFAWRFHQHPHLDGLPLWICRRDGRIVGLQAGLPVRLQVGDHDIAAAWAIDLMVEPEWRLRGIAPALGEALQDSTPLLCGLNISDAAHKAFRRAGWRDLGTVPRFARLIRPLAAGQTPLGSQAATPAQALASRLAAPLFAAFDAIALPAWRGRSRLEAIERFDERVAAVWRRAAPHYPVMARRDLETLRWRYDLAPHAEAYRRHYLTRNGETLGYVVTRSKGQSLVAVDYLCAPDDVAPLFAHTLRLARRSGARLLVCLAQAPAVQRRLLPLGFVRLTGPRFMIRPTDGLADARLADPAAWYLTDGDSDLDHGSEPISPPAADTSPPSA